MRMDGTCLLNVLFLSALFYFNASTFAFEFLLLMNDYQNVSMRQNVDFACKLVQPLVILQCSKWFSVGGRVSGAGKWEYWVW